jgi:hypothetical protein
MCHGSITCLQEPALCHTTTAQGLKGFAGSLVPYLCKVMCVALALVPDRQAAATVLLLAWQLHHQGPHHTLLFLCVLVGTEVASLLIQQQLVQAGLDVGNPQARITNVIR